MSSPPPSAAFLNESRIPNVYATSITAIALSSIFFVGRLISKRIQRLPLNASDYALILSLLCCYGLAIVNIWMTTVGLGRHLAWIQQGDPSLSNLKHLLKVFLADEVFYDLGIASVKISILLFYKGIFGGDRVFNLAANILMGIVSAWLLGNLLPSIFSCRPISGFWDLDPNAKCIDKTTLYITGSTINIATDLAILCLPLTKIFGLTLNRRRKIELVVVFSLGGIVCFVSVYRFTVLFNANSPDVPWETALVLGWSAIEVAVAITSACLPLMRPILSAVIPGSRSRTPAPPNSLEGRAAWSGTTKSSQPYSTITIGSIKVPLPLLGQRHRAASVGLPTNSSMAEPVPNQGLFVPLDSHHGIITDVRGSPAASCEIVAGADNTADGVVVTKTFTISSVNQSADETITKDTTIKKTSDLKESGRDPER